MSKTPRERLAIFIPTVAVALGVVYAASQSIAESERMQKIRDDSSYQIDLDIAKMELDRTNNLCAVRYTPLDDASIADRVKNIEARLLVCGANPDNQSEVRELRELAPYRAPEVKPQTTQTPQQFR